MTTPAPGMLLIADPFLKDPNFKRAVVFLCEHQDEGSFGFVLNRPYDYTLDELITGIEDIKVPVYFGGPVQMDTIHFLHKYPASIPGGFKVVDGIYWGGDFETAISLIRSGDIDTSNIRFYIGYSGWSKGQLIDEFKDKYWLTVPATQNLIFHTEIDQVWKNAIQHLGGDYGVLANYPIDPTLN